MRQVFSSAVGDGGRVAEATFATLPLANVSTPDFGGEVSAVCAVVAAVADSESAAVSAVGPAVGPAVASVACRTSAFFAVAV